MKKMKIIKIPDIILIIFLVITAISLNFLLYNFFNEEGSTVVISKNGEIVKKISITQENTYTFSENEDENIFKIKNGYVNMVSANCKDQLCIHQKPISNARETITCLPNKFIIEIESEEVYEIDSIAN